MTDNEKAANDLLNKDLEKAATEVRKEDNLYFEGVFWVVADTFEDILNGNFELVSEKFPVDYAGVRQHKFDKNFWSHKDIWEKKYQSKYGVGYKYYPRGRIVVRNGKAWMNMHSDIYLQQVVDAVTSEFCIRELEHIPSFKNDAGSHYDYQLK